MKDKLLKMYIDQDKFLNPVATGEEDEMVEELSPLEPVAGELSQSEPVPPRMLAMKMSRQFRRGL